MAKRIQFSAHGGPDVLEWTDFEPADPAEHEVQVEHRAIGINYIDTLRSQRALSGCRFSLWPGNGSRGCGGAGWPWRDPV